eukprot:gene695-biopygen717
MMSKGYVADCATSPANPPATRRRGVGMSRSRWRLNFFRIDAFSVSKVRKDSPEYGMMPISVGRSPAKRFRGPSVRTRSTSASWYRGSGRPLPNCTAIRARIRSSGYVTVLAVAPANEPARKTCRAFGDSCSERTVAKCDKSWKFSILSPDASFVSTPRYRSYVRYVVPEYGITRISVAPLPLHSARKPCSLTMLRPVLMAAPRVYCWVPTWYQIFTRSAGEITVFARHPATPPAHSDSSVLSGRSSWSRRAARTAAFFSTKTSSSASSSSSTAAAPSNSLMLRSWVFMRSFSVKPSATETGPFA